MRYFFVHILTVIAVESFQFSPYARRSLQSFRRAFEIESDQSSETDFEEEGMLDETFFDAAEMDANCHTYPQGIPEDHYVMKYFSVPPGGFGCLESVSEGRVTADLIARVGLSGDNVTVPVALMLLDPETYPSVSKSRKTCRKGAVIVNRGPLISNEATGEVEFNQTTCFQGKAIDRVYPGDVVGIQRQMHGGFYPGFETTKPQYELPVVYEDDHFAIVNKPAGIIVYTQGKGGSGPMSIRGALPLVLKPPKRGTKEIMRRPELSHRLDRPTSGLLVVGKTKPALIFLSRQFEDRLVNKTYTAILNGVPADDDEVHYTEDAAKGDTKWNQIDYELEAKSAVTFWRTLKSLSCEKAKNETLTVVEMMPKTGRFHQLRRHMAWVKETPIVGDRDYDGGGLSTRLRGRGLFLCSNRVSLAHPYFNTVEGKSEWEELPDELKWANGTIQLSEDGSTVEVHATIDVPNKFTSFLRKVETQNQYNSEDEIQESEDEQE
ncbi:unnamed protein product [Cylindrotheca closterium]|uniref:Pseudouridine synthase RsuA/RluA-like domain-containing protein n=1 Tax=Cylindrotheca closterium TaxID=2856 RepID=A0AAD2CH26_9STRA|nr:unnamed protein product [Cylindrotheca closterium]